MEYKRRLFSRIRFVIKVGLFTGATGLFVITLVFVYYFITLPSPQDLTNLQVPESTKIFDRTGKIVLYDVHGEYRRTVVPLEEISDYMLYATIAAEDANFYHHFGFDFRGFARAFIENIRKGKISQGGSTITQQFIKNAYLSSERTFTRKIKEVILAVELEIRYSKEQIITWYLNQVPYGSNAYGTAAAAQTFFGKKAIDLTLAESALLAALPQAPTYYSPYGNNPDRLLVRKDYVLDRMYELGYIATEEYEEAKQEELEFVQRSSSILAPHFVFYILEELEKTYGKNYLQSAGLQIRTSLDWELQSFIEEKALSRAIFNEKNFNGENISAVVLDPYTGEILAMVGSRDYFDEDIDGNVNVSTRPRQPGSSFKPFVYAKAFEKGYTPDTVLFDVPTEFNLNCNSDGSEETDRYGLGCYHPQNYTDTFSGPITLKEALAQSVNMPSVKTLYLAGVSDTIDLVKDMGIRTLKDPSLYGLSLVLGGGEVTLLEEISAYGVFATEGEHTPPQAILSIVDVDGRTIFEHEPKLRSVLDKSITRQITSILSSNELRTPVFGANSYLYTPDIFSAVKTGTTQNYRDAWTVGYTNEVVVGVWAGNNDGTFMIEGPGSAVAGPLWNDIITYIYTDKTSTPFPTYTPELTGYGVLDGRTSALRDDTGYHSILYFINKEDPLSGGNSRNDPQTLWWEAGIKNWLQKDDVITQIENSDLIRNIETSEISITLVSSLVISDKKKSIVEVSFVSKNPLNTISLSLGSLVLFSNQFSLKDPVFTHSVAVPILPSYIKSGPSILQVEALDYSGIKQFSRFPLTIIYD